MKRRAGKKLSSLGPQMGDMKLKSNGPFFVEMVCFFQSGLKSRENSSGPKFLSREDPGIPIHIRFSSLGTCRQLSHGEGFVAKVAESSNVSFMDRLWQVRLPSPVSWEKISCPLSSNCFLSSCPPRQPVAGDWNSDVRSLSGRSAFVHG